MGDSLDQETMVQSTTAQLVSRAAATTRSLVSRHSDAIVKRLEDLGMNDKKDLYVLLIEGVRRRQVRKLAPELMA